MPWRIDVGSSVATQVQGGDEELRLAIVTRRVVIVEDLDLRSGQRPIGLHAFDHGVAEIDEQGHRRASLSSFPAYGHLDAIMRIVDGGGCRILALRWPTPSRAG